MKLNECSSVCFKVAFIIPYKVIIVMIQLLILEGQNVDESVKIKKKTSFRGKRIVPFYFITKADILAGHHDTTYYPNLLKRWVRLGEVMNIHCMYWT